MHTSKNSSLSPNNQLFRPQRDVSPSNKQHSKSTRYYSAQQVSKVIKAYIQPRLNFLQNQLQQKQRTISTLNHKLDQNDLKLQNLSNLTHTLLKQQKHNSPSRQQTQTITQLLNSRLKSYQQTIALQLCKIRQQYTERADTRKVQARIQLQVQQMKRATGACIQQSRVRNNNYWLKIKQALNRINSKLVKMDQTMGRNQQVILQFRQQLGDGGGLKLEQAKVVGRKFVQLKKSVQNIWGNYQVVLGLQEQFRARIGQGNDSGLIQFSVEGRENEQPDGRRDSYNARHNVYNDRSYQQQYGYDGGNTFPMFRKKMGNNSQQKHLDHEIPSINESQDNIVLQYSRQQQANLQPPLNLKLSPQKPTKIQPRYYVPNISSTKSPSKSIFCQTTSPLRTSPHSSKPQHLHSANQLSCLNSTTNAYPNPNSRSTSFVNLSLENRQQMSESVRQRLEEIIQVKQMARPLLVYLDEISYLKNQDGNYIFDTSGNMFKVGRQQGRQLQRLGIITITGNNSACNNNLQNYAKKTPKRNNHMINGHQKDIILQSIAKSRSLANNSGQKIKSIAIKQSNI